MRAYAPDRISETNCAIWSAVEANEVFVVLSREADARLQAAGASYYPWSSQSLPAGITVGADQVMVRLVTS